MRIEVKYSGLKDRQTKVAENEALSLRMLHDDFDDPTWKHGDPIVGIMTFTDEPALEGEPSRNLEAEIDALKVRIETLEKRIPAK